MAGWRDCVCDFCLRTRQRGQLPQVNLVFGFRLFGCHPRIRRRRRCKYHVVSTRFTPRRSLQLHRGSKILNSMMPARATLRARENSATSTTAAVCACSSRWIQRIRDPKPCRTLPCLVLISSARVRAVPAPTQQTTHEVCSQQCGTGAGTQKEDHRKFGVKQQRTYAAPPPVVPLLVFFFCSKHLATAASRS